MLGRVDERSSGSEQKGRMEIPSATDAAIEVIAGPRAPTMTGGGPAASGGGLNIGVIRVWR